MQHLENNIQPPVKSKFRGYEIHLEDGEWLFSDTNEPTITTHQLRPCGFCKMMNTPEGHDGCLGELPGVMNACCGHGELNAAYIQFEGGRIIRGSLARWSVVGLKALNVCLRWLGRILK